MIEGRTTTALVLEDEVFIAMDIEETLTEAGFSNVEAFGTCDLALQWLDHNTPDVAVIDFRLHGVDCAPVAKILLERRVGTIVFSGNSYEPDYHGELFANFPWLVKPASGAELIAALREAVDDPGAKHEPAHG